MKQKMFGRFNSRLYRFLKVKCETKSENSRILILSDLYIVSFVICFFSQAVPIYFQLWSSVLVSVTNSIIYAIGFWLIYARRYTLSKYLIFFSTITAITLNASITGPGNGNFIYLFPIFSSLFIIFDIKDIKHIVIIFVYIAVNLLFLEITNYSFLTNGETNETYIDIHYYFAIGFSLGLQFFILFILVSSLKKIEIKLRNANQRVLRQNGNLLSVNHQLDSFVYKASHDLRAPLASVLGLIALMRKSSKEEEMHTYMDMQEKSINKLDNHIIDILTISRNTRVEPQSEKFDIEQLILESFNELKHLKIDRLFSLTVSVNGEALIFSDKSRWIVILDNLFSNAIKYYDSNKPESQINVEVSSASENRLIVSFWDNGVGIKEEQLPKVFTMYHRAHSESFGSGLGLFIVKEVIIKLKGTISIQSEYGGFTQINIGVPIGHV